MVHPEISDNPNIPERCAPCPIVCDLRDELAGLQAEQQVAEEISAGLMVVTDEISAVVSEEAPGEDPEFYTGIIRGMGQVAATDMDRRDAIIEAVTGEITDTTSACGGAVEMTVVREGLEYTAYFCGSSGAYEGGLNHTSSHLVVRRYGRS